MRTVLAGVLLVLLGAQVPDSYRPYVPYDPFGWGHRWGADSGTGGDAGDPCDPNPCEHGTCSPSGGSYSCECETGWEGTICDTDINECTGHTDDCNAHATCANTEGSFTCTCGSGWTGTGHGAEGCTDVNECLTENGGCSAVATCTNTPGSRTCACNTGWTGDGLTCVDENECARDAGVCDPLVACGNVDGGYTCADCPTPGYTGSGYVADGGCTNVDECAVDAGAYCQNGASCSDTDGGYACTCTHDWTGTNCTDESGTAASIAWKATWTATPSAVYSATTSGSPTAISPTFECRGEQYTSGTGWPCTNWSFTSGTVTKVETPFYPSNWSTNATAPRLATTGVFTSSSSVSPGWATDFTLWALVYNKSVIAGRKTILQKANGGTVDFHFNINTATVEIVIYDASAGVSYVASGLTVTAGTWNAIGVTYHAVGGAGDNVVRFNVNGSTNANSSVKLLRDTSGSVFTLGSNANYHTTYIAGGVDGVAYSADQLAAVVKSLRGLIPVTGNSAIAFTRSSVASCQPTNTSSIFYLGPNFPCVTEKGLRIYPAYVLKGRYSEAFDSWTGTGTGSDAPAVTANTGDTTAPDGASTAELVAFKEVDHSGDVSDLKSPTAVTLSATSWTHAVYAKSVSGTTTLRIGWRTADSATCSYTDCTVGASAWTRCAHTATATAAEYVPFLGNNRICDNTQRTEQQIYLWGDTFSNNDEVVPYSVVTTADSSIPASDFSYTSQQTLGEVCYAAKVGPDMTSTHASGALGLFAHDSYGAGADDRGARVTGTSATAIVQDHTGGGTKTATATVTALNQSSAQILKYCFDNDGHSKIVNGTSIKTSTMTGTGSDNTAAVPTTVYLGQDQSSYLGWYLQGFAECTGYSSAGCTP